MKNLIMFLRLHIDIPLIILVAAVIVILHQPFANLLLGWMGFAQTNINWPDWMSTVGPSILANAISALILVPSVFWLLQTKKRAGAVGRFKAYDVVNGQKVAWGEVTLTYNLITNRIKGVMKNKDITLKLEGELDQSHYFRGHYVEVGRARRRWGGFLLKLDGNDVVYEGKYAYVDPSNVDPVCGDVIWERI